MSACFAPHCFQMEGQKSTLFLFASLCLHCFSSLVQIHSQLLPIANSNASQVQTYIVHLQMPKSAKFLSAKSLANWHKSFLPVTNLDSGKPRLIYSYREVIDGFAARLTPEEVKAMERLDGFLYAQLDQKLPLHTTYSPELLGLSDWGPTWAQSLYGEGIIVGVLDTGILPNHPSFSDDAMPPPPNRWKGQCAFSNCNNKLIGGRAFSSTESRPSSPLDISGHGTHVAGIAAGNFVDDAEVLGMAKGLASGMAPKAHLAVYRVCSEDGCNDSDVLAGIEQAIHDGVDVVSMSFGGLPRPIYQDSVAIGSFAAVRKGIFACASAGNFGPRKGMVSHDAPWVLTVGASSTDRRIRVTVKLGNGMELDGESAYQPSEFISPTFLPIVFPGIDGDLDALHCYKGALDDVDVKGKIVLCYSEGESNINKGNVVENAGGAGMIVMNKQSQGFTKFAEAHRLPVSHLSYIDGRKIRSYVYSSTNSTPTAAIIFKGTMLGVRPSHAVASFSSRGPSLLNGGILKPDIIAPGVNILSAWPGASGQIATSAFNLQSGTSAAAPHVAGIAALIKNKHPQWPPSAIQSAIITSTQTSDLDGNPFFDEASYNKSADIFAKGAGLVNPWGAMDPGLVYSINPNHYVPYLCGLGYTNRQVTMIMRGSIQCNSSLDSEQLNYPSISVTLDLKSEKRITRTVTNVGEADSVYWARIYEPEGVRVDLSHYKLDFSRLYEEQSFDIRLRIRGSHLKKGHVSEGRLSWISSNHVVSSPITVTFS